MQIIFHKKGNIIQIFNLNNINTLVKLMFSRSQYYHMLSRLRYFYFFFKIYINGLSISSDIYVHKIDESLVTMQEKTIQKPLKNPRKKPPNKPKNYFNVS